ncbi:MAG: AmmeMemoRadiSam system radical SAM enzyme [Thermoplasmata archaeon]
MVKNMKLKREDMSILHEAMYWHRESDGVRCDLCPHRCYLKIENMGICGVRKNVDNKLYSEVYGFVSAISNDPIEKKPLFHFHPGSWIFSVSTIGCNLRCMYCQNYELSRGLIPRSQLEYYTPEELVSIAKNYGSKGIAWTYNEPSIWFEYTLDTSKISKKDGMYNVYVTNGYINEDPLREIAPYMDAMNIDVKGFTDEFYKKYLGGTLEPVLNTVILAKSLQIHIELTYLVVPTLNDKKEDIEKYLDWVIETLGLDIPLHFSRFHPDYKLNYLPATPIKTMQEIYKLAKERMLRYVYLGNYPSMDFESTYCYNCGAKLIERFGFDIKILNLSENGTCKRCGAKISIIL